VWKTPKNSHRDTKIRREHAHVINDASTSTHFYAHPYTRERISHTRDCNLIDLNASHNIHLHIVSHILSAYFLGRGFVCMFVCRKTDALTDAQRTTSNVKKIQTSEETRLKTICAPLTTRTRSHRRWIAIITRERVFLASSWRRGKQRKKLRREAAILFYLQRWRSVEKWMAYIICRAVANESTWE